MKICITLLANNESYPRIGLATAYGADGLEHIGLLRILEGITAGTCLYGGGNGGFRCDDESLSGAGQPEPLEALYRQESAIKRAGMVPKTWSFLRVCA